MLSRWACSSTGCCRPSRTGDGLTDENLKLGDRACERFFADVYEKECPRLKELLAGQEHSRPAKDALFSEVDRLIRTSSCRLRSPHLGLHSR